MNRPWNTWLVFALCSLVVLVALGRVSLTALRLEEDQWKVGRQSEIEERVRLALWRMDAALTSLMIEESARTPEAYDAYSVPPSGLVKAGKAQPGSVAQADSLVPSPLLTLTTSNILLHFQYDQNRRLNSPQFPAGEVQRLVGLGRAAEPSMLLASNRLNSLRSLLEAPAVVAETNASSLASSRPSKQPAPRVQDNGEVLVHESGMDWPVLAGAGVAAQSQAPQQVFYANADPREMQQAQQVRNTVEYNVRANVYQQAQQKSAAANLKEIESREAGPGSGVFKPVWIQEQAFLVRRVERAGIPVVQGVWLDWPNLRAGLLASIKDLFPSATLAPWHQGDKGTEPRLLAALPAVLKPGPVPAEPPPLVTPVKLMLAMAWLGVLVAAVAVALLLHGTLSLSERRAAFVSAVTHELRTPLTTFRMYSEMLAEEMVPDPARRKQYLDTLCSEANRLSHLVENVLAYARLERGSARSRVEQVTLGCLVERIEPRLAQRARQSDMTLQLDGTPETFGRAVHVDVGAVEQILFNLVDNACKYAAASSEDKTIHLEALPDHRYAILRIRDHGRGITAESSRQLFKPFHKSAHEAARTAPGVGLGLALCRRLSRSMGGDLRLASASQGGACFELRLPFNAAAVAEPTLG